MLVADTLVSGASRCSTFLSWWFHRLKTTNPLLWNLALGSVEQLDRGWTERRLLSHNIHFSSHVIQCGPETNLFYCEKQDQSRLHKVQYMLHPFIEMFRLADLFRVVDDGWFTHGQFLCQLSNCCVRIWFHQSLEYIVIDLWMTSFTLLVL